MTADEDITFTHHETGPYHNGVRFAGMFPLGSEAKIIETAGWSGAADGSLGFLPIVRGDVIEQQCAMRGLTP